MNRIVRALVLLIAIFVSGCEGHADGGRVSLSSVIAGPAQFVDSDLTVVGYHKSGTEPPFLYLTREHAQIDDWPSGVALWETVDGQRFSALAGCQNQYVMVVGRLSVLPTEQLGITDIVRVVALGDGRDSSKICFNATTN